VDWTIEYYETPGGKCPVKEFIDSLSPESKAKYIFIADLLEEHRRVYLKKEVNT